MNISVQLCLAAAVLCLLQMAAPTASEGRFTRVKQQRPTRGFKNTELMTARGFGKRNHPPLKQEAEQISRQSSERRTRDAPVFKTRRLGIGRDFGKRSEELNQDDEAFGENIWELLGNPSDHDALGQGEDKGLESIPVDWFVDEMLNNPEFTRTVVRKFVDLNQDGMLSPEELLRNVF